MVEGELYDGCTAVRHRVQIETGATSLIVKGEGLDFSVPRTLLVPMESRRAGYKVFGRRDIPGWRLHLPIAEGAGGELPSVSPHRYGRWIERLGLPQTIGLSLCASTLVLAALYHAPAWLAPFVPPSIESTIGDAAVSEIGGSRCTGQRGARALAGLVQKLAPRSSGLKVSVVDLNVRNAAALPGRNILLFRGLLEEVANADEIAGILAHEIAHVEEQHVTEGMIREMGLGLISVSLGGDLGSGVTGMMSLGYSRAAEREADRGAIARLVRAGISPAATAGFFERLASREAETGGAVGGLSYLSTHPLSKERERLFRAASEQRRDYRPALPEQDWLALRHICSQS